MIFKSIDSKIMSLLSVVMSLLTDQEVSVGKTEEEEEEESF